VNYPRILGIETATHPIRLTQEQSFFAAGYKSERIRKIFLNNDIGYRHFYFGGTLNHAETPDQMNKRYLSGAMKIGCRASGTDACGRDLFTIRRLTLCPEGRSG